MAGGYSTSDVCLSVLSDFNTGSLYTYPVLYPYISERIPLGYIDIVTRVTHTAAQYVPKFTELLGRPAMEYKKLRIFILCSF